MLFCPHCSNMLFVEHSDEVQFFCQTCPYVHRVVKEIVKQLPVAPKKVDDVLGGAETWENVDATDVKCPKCGFGRAFFMLIQIRSADEPMTEFYKCCSPECGHQWREG
eukprot:GCRY01000956.1.p1 GENE.GCRY01000956.1~~GCRY01000956.1.p1  ORF type:complete len:108 (+),score=20.48 GCRY01000956.1:215-538(+)